MDSGQNLHRRVKALELAESLVGRQIAVGLVKTAGAPMTKRVVDAADTLLEFLEAGEPKTCPACGVPEGAQHAPDCDHMHIELLQERLQARAASSNGDAAPRPSATDTTDVGGPASAPAAPVERALTHQIDATGLTDGRPVFTGGIERDTLDVIRDALKVSDPAVRAEANAATDGALRRAGIDPKKTGGIFYFTEAEGQALVDQLDALLADGAPQADVPPPALVASPNDAWLGAMTLLDTAIVRANAKAKRQELIDLICNVNHAARIEDVPPDALEAAAQEVEGLVGALGTGLIGLLRDRAAMRGR